jgi:predicted membrane protein
MLLSNPSLRQWAKGTTVALLAFLSLGTVSALWSNPLFMRMTPVGGWEIGLLGALSMLVGLYVAIRRPACADHTAGVGGVLGFLGIACPVCNKILLLLFGGELLLTYFEPVRIYVAAAGTAILAVAVVLEWRRGLLLTDAPHQMARRASRETI